MFDEASKARANEDAFARLTGLGLLIEMGGWGIWALLAFILGVPSPIALLTVAMVIAIGALLGCLLLIAPRATLSSRPGRLMLDVVVVAQLLVLVGLVIWIAQESDPRLGIETGAIGFGFAAAAFTVLVLTGCVRALLSMRPDRRSSKRRRIASRIGLVAAAACLGGVAVAALADTTGLSCAAFSFDGDRWRSNDSERIAKNLVKCDTLISKTRGEVREMLGPGGGKGRSQHFGAGVVHGSDAQLLIVNYDGTGRVRRAHLLYPPD